MRATAGPGGDAPAVMVELVVADELHAGAVSSSTIWSMSSTYQTAMVAGDFPAVTDW